LQNFYRCLLMLDLHACWWLLAHNRIQLREKILLRNLGLLQLVKTFKWRKLGLLMVKAFKWCKLGLLMVKAFKWCKLGLLVK